MTNIKSMDTLCYTRTYDSGSIPIFLNDMTGMQRLMQAFSLGITPQCTQASRHVNRAALHIMNVGSTLGTEHIATTRKRCTLAISKSLMAITRRRTANMSAAGTSTRYKHWICRTHVRTVRIG